MNISGDMSIAAAAPPPAKVDSPKPSDGDSSFQKTLDAKVQVTEENNKEATDKEKNADVIAGAAAVTAQPTPVVINLTAAVNLATQAAVVNQQNTDAGSKAGDALSLLNQAAVKTAPVVVPETPVEPQPVAVQTPVVQTAPVVVPAPAVPVKTSADVQKPAEIQAQSGIAEVDASLEASQKGTTASSKPNVEAVVTKASNEKPLLVTPTQVAGDSKVQMQAFSNALSSVNAKPATTNTPIMQQVIDGIKSMADNGQNTLRLQIHPENMGRIEIKFVSGSEGVQVFITADKTSTKNLLETNLSQLQQSLQGAGVKISGMNVGQQNNQGNSSAWQAPAQSNPYAVSTSTGQPEPIENIKWNMVGSLSALDARV
jgi:flagellar hook-length control protein FliK